MTNLILLLTSVFQLLQAVNSAEIPIDIRLKALDISYQAIELAQPIESPMLGAIHLKLDDTLKLKPAHERAIIKSAKIAELNPIGVYDNSTYGLKIEIKDIKAIDNEVQLYARAWKGTQQLGFSQDGSVEWERFRIINPPILVDDINGDIIREWTDSFTGITKQRKLREDPSQALKESLAHTISLIGKTNNNIVKGKEGRTTLIVYPDADPESTSVDGITRRESVNETWSTIRSGAGTNALPSNADGSISIGSSLTTNQFKELRREVVLFDTSALTADATISSAIMSIKANDKTDNLTLGDGFKLVVVSSTPASNTNLVAADFNIANWGSTEFSQRIARSGFTVGSFSNFTINATGLSNISKTSITKFGIRDAGYDIDNVQPTWVIDTFSQINWDAADTAGTTSDPKLVIEYTAPTTITSQVIIIE